MSDKKSLYLKYRPVQLDDIVGQRPVVATLKQASLNNDFSHAYLFSGNHGCGKTSAARILASLMVCEKIENGKVCGICRACRTIHAGVCVDVKELDGATNRGIDNVKMLIDAAQWSPQELKKKVYLIDECLSGLTRINTEKGLVYIGDIVRNSEKIKVLSYNEKDKKIEYKPITGWFKNSGKEIYKLGFESEGRIYASNNHLIRTPSGFKKVKNLNVGDMVCRNGIELTNEQKQLAYGSLLGDASITKNISRKIMPRDTNARIKFVQGEKQKKYLLLKHKIMSIGSFTSHVPKEYRNIGFKGCKESKTWAFGTKCSSRFTKIYNDVTKNGKKHIGDKWLEKIDWMGIAFWFCDDGAMGQWDTVKKDGYAITFHSQGFSLKENIILQNWLQSKGLTCKILFEEKNNHKLYRIALGKDSSLLLMNKIWKYIPKCMDYKLKGFRGNGEKYEYAGLIESNPYSLILEKLTVKEFVRYESETYDIEVKDNHNYFASGTLVHNCHQLTKEATSALLKILEEPPAYLAFILCTTEANKILPTILSRCQRFNFSKIPSKDISGRLSMIAQKESINIEDDAIGLVAKMARGSMRDAIGYLEQIGTVASSKKISAVGVQKYFGITDRLAILNIVKSIIDGNIPLLLDQTNDMIMASVDIKQIVYEISDMFRNAMVIKAQSGSSKLIDLPDNEVQELKKIGDALSIDQMLKLAHLFSDVDKKIGFNINERWIMEATLINCVVSLRK